MFDITCQRCGIETQRKIAGAKYCLPCSKESAKNITARYNKIAIAKRELEKSAVIANIEATADRLAPNDDVRSYLNECIAINLPTLKPLNQVELENYLAEEVENYLSHNFEYGDEPTIIGVCQLCKFANGVRYCDDRHQERVIVKTSRKTSPVQKATAKAYGDKQTAMRRTGDGKLPTWSRLDILRRDNFMCALCNLPIAPDVSHRDRLAGEVDHIIPVSAGGSNDESNVQATHRVCNRWKHDTIGFELSPRQVELVRQLISEHFPLFFS